MNWWVSSAYNSGGPALVVAWAGWVIIAICLHELAHGWVAIWQGDRTPIESGHMTWNPLVHMGVPSLVMFAVTGIAWGAMPVNPRKMKHRYSDVLVSLAGPMMNFLLAAVCILAGGVLAAMSFDEDYSGSMLDFSNRSWPARLLVFVFIGGALNIGLGIFNLVPVPPLDGSRIVGGLIPAYQRLFSTGAGNAVSLVIFLLAFFFAGKLIFGAGALVVGVGIGVLAGLLRLVGVG